MDSDVPRLEVCNQLAKAGWHAATFFRYEYDDSLGWRLCQAAGRWKPARVTDAPTIGEMLVYIRRQGPTFLTAVVFFYYKAVNREDPLLKAVMDVVAWSECLWDLTPDALALALSAALGKEVPQIGDDDNVQGKDAGKHSSVPGAQP